MRYMEISTVGLSLIKKYEGCQLKAYKCPAGKWTIGYGHTHGVNQGMTITGDIADKLLMEDVHPIESLLNGMKINFRQGQFDALCSLIFNISDGSFKSSTLKRKITSGASDTDIANEIKKWDKATVNGKKVALAGLTKRRAEEAALWKQ